MIPARSGIPGLSIPLASSRLLGGYDDSGSRRFKRAGLKGGIFLSADDSFAHPAFAGARPASAVVHRVREAVTAPAWRKDHLGGRRQAFR